MPYLLNFNFKVESYSEGEGFQCQVIGEGSPDDEVEPETTKAPGEKPAPAGTHSA